MANRYHLDPATRTLRLGGVAIAVEVVENAYNEDYLRSCASAELVGVVLDDPYNEARESSSAHHEALAYWDEQLRKARQI